MLPSEARTALVRASIVVFLFIIGYAFSGGHVPDWLGGQFTGGLLLAGSWLGVVSIIIIRWG